MIDPRAAVTQQPSPTMDPALVARLPLPSHVTVRVDGRSRRGWLIGSSHEPTGWIGRVQYDDDCGQEVTAEIPAEQISPAGAGWVD
ncbi:hypothetical protein GCM10009630_34580 [Kribbella jejuensis]|uniref:Uncharacterized protein n=1 Tax=Kribbella jejuensis TaxID=236068 RepID=A0A542DT61_9ACTN|nr:hypothetical protein [Kribbella jejuensis]TQJ06204.1 hypothetical protein FB475_5859 [Kribbella jejuensis]